MNICNTEPHIDECPKLDIVVSFRQQNRGTIKQLGTRVERFLEKIQQEEGLFIERAEIHSCNLSTCYKSQCELLARLPLPSWVRPSVREKQNHSSTGGLALEPDTSSTLEIYGGIRAGGLRWCVAVRRSAHVL